MSAAATVAQAMMCASFMMSNWSVEVLMKVLGVCTGGLNVSEKHRDCHRCPLWGNRLDPIWPWWGFNVGAANVRMRTPSPQPTFPRREDGAARKPSTSAYRSLDYP